MERAIAPYFGRNGQVLVGVFEEFVEKARNSGKFTIINEGVISSTKFDKIASRIKKEYDIDMFFIDRNNQKWQDLYKSCQDRPLHGFFTATYHPSKNYPGINLDGPALYLFSGNSITGPYEVTSYTVQHELYHMKMFNRLKELFPNNYVKKFYEIPDVIHESYVLSEFVKSSKFTNTWSKADIFRDLESFNLDFKKTMELAGFEGFDLETYLKNL
ncbi:MAG: hypothetical protein ACI8ZM_000061 [Crocinitomix sp.]|jgi:hypothetical protein